MSWFLNPNRGGSFQARDALNSNESYYSQIIITTINETDIIGIDIIGIDIIGIIDIRQLIGLEQCQPQGKVMQDENSVPSIVDHNKDVRE